MLEFGQIPHVVLKKRNKTPLNEQLRTVKIMSNFWNFTKYGFALVALPLAVTAAASAHQRIANATPISLEVTPVVSTLANIGVERCHTVALNRIGGVDGRIVSFASNQSDRGLSDLVVRFVKNGKTIRQGKTNSDGVFSVNNVPEGVYSFIASGENGYAAYSVQVLADSTGQLPRVVEVAAVPEVKAIDRLISKQVRSKVAQSGGGSAELAEAGVNRVIVEDGNLAGRVLDLDGNGVAQMQIDILKDGVSVASVVSGNDGEYVVPDVQPGAYGMVAAGANAVAVVGFEAVEVAGQPLEGSFVSTKGDMVPNYGESLVVYVAAGQDLSSEVVVEEEFVYENASIEYIGQSIACGGACGSCGPAADSCCSPAPSCGGGGFGGGGFGGGGGGLGRLVAIGGLTVGVVALAGDGGATPVSPVTP